MKEQLFTIQQYANLHEIGKRTLHFYDEIGLFCPAIKKENGYRYYTLSQGAVLEMILTLRELDMSLDDIKKYMTKRNAESFDNLLITKQKEIDKKIKQLKELKNLLRIKEKQMSYLKEDLHSIQIVSCKKKNYLITSLNERNYVDAMIEHGKSMPYHLFNMELGTMNHTDNIEKEIYNNMDYIFSNLGTLKGNYIRPAGQYIRAFHIGNFSDLTPTYKKIMAYCQKHNLKLKGYSYEIGINDLCIMNIEEYVTMIEIQIEN